MYWSKHNLCRILAAIGFLILIFDSRLVLEGVQSGIDLCVKTVIPSLFPFFVLSTVLLSLQETNLCYPVQLLIKTLKIPNSAASVLVPAFFGGYPVGAKCVGDLYHKKQISRDEANRLLSFCSNAGPSFLFGIISGFFPDRKMIWMLWMIHVISAVITAMIIPAKKTERFVPQDNKYISEKSILFPAVRAMCIVCCWVALFRGIINFMNNWFCWRMPVWIQVCFMGILELTNGCCQLFLIEDIRLRFIVCSCLLAFGGICVLLQTASVTDGLSLACYIKGKIIQTIFSFLISCTIVLEKSIIFAGFLPILIMFLRKIENRYRNPQTIPV